MVSPHGGIITCPVFPGCQLSALKSKSRIGGTRTHNVRPLSGPLYLLSYISAYLAPHGRGLSARAPEASPPEGGAHTRKDIA